MIVYSVNDKRFNKFGRVLKHYDYSELFGILAKKDCPEKGITYTASDAELEACDTAKEFKKRGFGGYPIQLGYVAGENSVLNCLEYHKSSEFNIAMNDVILILGSECDIDGGTFNTSKCTAFLLPSGTGIELYATTLHYAPFGLNNQYYKIICVLPRGTNNLKAEFTSKTDEDKMCFGINKWLIAHPKSLEVKQGAYCGLTGENIKYNDLEEIQ